MKINLFNLLILLNLTSCNILKKKFDSKDNNVIIITNFKGDSLSNLIGQLKSNRTFKPITDSIEKTFNLKNSSTNKNFFPNSLIHKNYLSKNSNKKYKLNDHINKSFFKSTLNQHTDNQNLINLNLKNFDDASEIEDKQQNSFHQYNNHQNYNPQSYNNQNLNPSNSNHLNYNHLNYNHLNYNHPNYNHLIPNHSNYNYPSYKQEINNFNQQTFNQQKNNQQNHQDFNQLNYFKNSMIEQNNSNYDKLFNSNKVYQFQNENLRRNQENFYKVDFRNYLSTQIPSFYYPIKENFHDDLFNLYVNKNKFDYLKDNNFNPYIKPNYLNRNLFNLSPIPFKKLNKKFQFEDENFDFKEFNKTDDNQILKNFDLINNKILTHIILNNYLKNLSMNITDPFIKKNKLLSAFEDENQG